MTKRLRVGIIGANPDRGWRRALDALSRRAFARHYLLWEINGTHWSCFVD